MEQIGRPIEILLVEDSPGDIRLTREAFLEAKISNHLEVVTDGAAALDYLYRRQPYAAATRPDLILLDLNLPKRDGREVLQVIKSDPDLARIPVVVLTTSGSVEDIENTYNLHANCYITKPVDIDSFFEVTRSIEDFWLCVVTLPNGASQKP